MNSIIIMDLLRKILIFAVILLCSQGSESLAVAGAPPPCSRFKRSAPSGSDSVQRYPDELCCIDCEPNRLCPLLRSPNNGVVRVNDGRATYTCNNGYTLFGSYSRFCLSSGSWSGSNPSCQLISRLTCPVLIIPSNGQVSVSSYFIGGIATYSCKTGYRLSGSSSRTCLRGCYWSGSDPSCQLIAENCPVLNNPSNGRVSVSSYVIGGRAIYSCNIGIDYLDHLLALARSVAAGLDPIPPVKESVPH
ncbi:E-selectin-like isoform X3 [Halichondria panicea]|uniref:E-selectin-like isoform X3 n=1 Tax=Halichondria panicea TaxID=6063 RepID=UPI00312B9D76